MCKWVTIANIKSWCWKHCSLLPLLYSHAGTCCVTLYHQQQTPVHLLWKHVIKQGLITQTFLINSREMLSLTGIEVIAGTISYIPCHRVVKRVKVETSHYPHVKHRPWVLKNALQGMELFSMNAHSIIFKIKPISCYESSDRKKNFFWFCETEITRWIFSQIAAQSWEQFQTPVTHSRVCLCS